MNFDVCIIGAGPIGICCAIEAKKKNLSYIIIDRGCLVNSLYRVYEEGLKDFDKKYITLLESGGSLRYKELLKPFNLNPSKSNFWKKGLSVIENLIDNLEEL